MQRNSASHLSLRRHVLWRGLVACAVAYALAITAVLSGALQAEWAVEVAVGLAGEHCAADARAAGTNPEAPAGLPDDSSHHCALCNLAIGPAVLPPEPAVAFTALPWVSALLLGSDQDVPLWRGHPGKLPRGPPRAEIAA